MKVSRMCHCEIDDLHVALGLRQRLEVLLHRFPLLVLVEIIVIIVLAILTHDIVSIKLLVTEIDQPLDNGQEIVQDDRIGPVVLLAGIAHLPKGRGASWAMLVKVATQNQHHLLYTGAQKGEETHASNQFPNTPLVDLTPPTCTLSLRHLSSPLNTEKVVHLTSPSFVRRQYPLTAD